MSEQEEFKLDLNAEADPAEPQYSEIEQEAMAKGWKPDGAEGKKFLSAEEFLDRQPIYDEIGKLKKLVNQQKKSMESFQQHHEATIRRMEESKERELQKLKRKALDDADLDKVEQYDEELEQHRKQTQARRATETPSTTEASPEVEYFNSWVEKNSWYEDDVILRGAANTVGTQIQNSGKQLTLEEFYATVEKEVRKQYPDRFPDYRKPQHSAVEADTSRGRGTGKRRYTERDLDPDTRAMMNNIIRGSNGLMTKDKYIAELEQSGYFKTL